MSKDDDLISILMPTYNVEDYVSEALESLLQQTYQKIEIIIVDDCSTDNTYSILKEYAQRDSRIKLYRNTSNSRIVISLNKALAHAHGSFIARMDGDDISMPHRIEVMHRYLLENDKCDIVGSFSAAMNSDGDILAKRSFPQSDSLIKKTLRFSSTIQHIWMARRKVYDELKGYRPFPGAEDYDFLLRAKQAGFGLQNYPEVLYRVRLRKGNTDSARGIERLKTKEYVYRYSLEKHPIDELEIDVGQFNRYLKHRPSEAMAYKKAAALANKARHERGNKALLVKDTIHAALISRYMRSYLFEVTLVRLAVFFEKLMSPGKS